MNLNFILNHSKANLYKSNSQKVRVISESWVSKNIYCPACGSYLSNFENNKPVADFFCSACHEEYELKSKMNSFGNKIVDGAYKTMIKRLKGDNIPNLFLLNYDKSKKTILNFFVIPKQFFIPNIIEERKPLSLTAKRAGWIGCNILLESIPNSGKIYYVKNSSVVSQGRVHDLWSQTLFVRDEKDIYAKGWILDIIKCIEILNKNEFTLRELYKFEYELKQKYPNNHHIKDKIRQQLQVLRSHSFLKFLGNGRYKLL